MDEKKEGLKKRIREIINELNAELVELSEYIYDNPETAFNEHKSCLAICQWLEKYGFTVDRGVGKLETAFRAFGTQKNGKPVVAFLAEYDALPEIGHACGHNLITTMSVGAAVAADRILKEAGLEGTVVVLGTPAEEGGGGKVLMLQEGCFDGIDCAMMIHPASRTMVEDYSLAIARMVFTYYGKAAHTAAFPWQGANALEATIQTFNLINAWRCQMREGTRVNGIITKGGTATNVIPELAEAKFSVRSPNKQNLEVLVELVSRCARNAADSMGVVVEIEREGLGYDPVMNNLMLENLMADNFKLVGEEVLPRLKDQGIGSTDMGNVTRALPAIHGHLKIKPDINTHTLEFADACIGETGRQALLKGAKVMGLTALDLFYNPVLVEEMWNIFKKQEEDNA